MDKDNIKAKLKKLKTLAEQGIGGEKETAQVLYNKLLIKFLIIQQDVKEIEKKM